MDTPLTLDPRTTALLLVDLQNDFCAPEGFYGRSGRNVRALQDAVAPNVAMLARARAAGLTIAFTRLVHDHQRGAMEDRHVLRPKAWTTSGERLVPGTWGADVVDALTPREGEIVIDKAGYSAFHDTPLEAELRARGVRTILLSGVTTYACVLASAFAAFDRDFDVVLLTDLVGSWAPALDTATGQIVDFLMGHARDSASLAFAPTTNGDTHEL